MSAWRHIGYISVIVVILFGSAYGYILLQKAQASELSLFSDRMDSLSKQSRTFEEDNLRTKNFLKNYAIVLNHLGQANVNFELARSNKDLGEDYTSGKGYYYDSATNYYNAAKDQNKDAREYLLKAKNKLISLQNDSVILGSFWVEDTENRINEVEVFLEIVDSQFLLIDYQADELYEINYGSEAQALKYFELYEIERKKYNRLLKEFSVVGELIDIQWEQDWHPESKQ